MPLPRGIVAVVQTPFDDTSQVDIPSLDRLVDDAVDAGVNGLLSTVVASEVAFLSLAEREQIVQRLSARIDGRVPLLVGASSDDPAICRRFSALAEEAGAAGWLVAVPPALYGRPDRILPFFKEVTQDTGLPLVIQDLQFAGCGLSMEIIRNLRDELPSLAGLKIETVPAGPKYTAVRESLGPNFFIAGGWAVMQFIEALDRSVDAMIPESSMIRVYAAIQRRYAAGCRDEALEIFQSLLPILAFTNQEISTSIAFFKRLLVQKGIFTGEAMRMPGFTWDRYNRRIADELIALYRALEDRAIRW